MMIPANGNLSQGLLGWVKNGDTTLALDNSDFISGPSSLIVTHAVSTVGWSGAWTWYPIVGGNRYQWKARVKAPAGTQLYMQQNYYDASNNFVESVITPFFVCDGTWQTISGEYVSSPSTTHGNFGVFFRDDTPAAYAASLGVSFHVDDVVLTLEDTATTPLQPTLPTEAGFSDPEVNFMEDSPPGLFAENQDSNIGLKRKLWADKVQQLITQQNTIYNELFPDTSTDFLDVWEADVGLPSGRAATRSVAQRQLDVLTRLKIGPFTQPLRNQIIEAAIISTFGTPVSISESGVPLSASGVPLYAEAAPVSSLYSVRENIPGGRNLLANGNFENNVTGWAPSNATVARVTTQSKSGLASLQMTGTVATNQFVTSSVAISGSTAGRIYSISFWVKATGSAIGKTLVGLLQASGGAAGATNSTATAVTLTGSWQLVTASMQLVQSDRTTITFIAQLNSGAIGDVVFIDAAQVELISAALGKNKLINGSVEFDLSGFTEQEYAGAAVTMTRNNIGPFPIPDGAWNIQALVTAFGDVGIGIGNSGGVVQLKPNTTYTLSAYVAGSNLTTMYIRRVFPTPDVQIGNSVTFDVAGGYKKISGTFTTDSSGQAGLRLMLTAGTSGLTASTFFIDAVQLEEGSVATAYEDPVLSSPFVDPEKTPYYYEVRILNTSTPDMTSLIRELKRITPASIGFDVYNVATI